MNKNQDTVLLYEYMEKSSLTIRIKVRLDETVDAKLLTEASREAFGRFPYFSVQLTIDEGQNYAFEPNSRPIAVLPERDRRMVLGSEELNRHLFFITYRDDTVWFSCSHSICGGFGVMFWVKSTLYLYLCKKYGNIGAPKDIKLPGTPVTEGELYFPDASALPTDEPILRYNGGNTNLGIGRMLKYIFNPFAQDKYYYELRIPAKEFMDYAVSIDGTPNTVFVAMMYKAMTRFLGKKEGKEFISGRLAADYRNDIGANQSYRDFARLLHIKYEWDMKDEPISKLSMRARGAIITQSQPELSYERFRRLVEIQNGITAQPTLKLKKEYAAKNSLYRNDERDIYTISYVGRIDFGEMEKHIRGLYSLTDGDLMLEINALNDEFYICYQLIDKNREPLERFLEVLDEEGIPYKVSDRQIRYLPRIEFPKL